MGKVFGKTPRTLNIDHREISFLKSAPGMQSLLEMMFTFQATPMTAGAARWKTGSASALAQSDHLSEASAGHKLLGGIVCIAGTSRFYGAVNGNDLATYWSG